MTNFKCEDVQEGDTLRCLLAHTDSCCWKEGGSYLIERHRDNGVLMFKPSCFEESEDWTYVMSALEDNDFAWELIKASGPW